MGHFLLPMLSNWLEFSKQQHLFIPKQEVQIKVIHSLELKNKVLAAYNSHNG